MKNAAPPRPGPASPPGHRPVQPPRRSGASLALTVLGWAPVAAALVAVAAYLWLASQRVGYPQPIEWLEGGVVQAIGRVAHGHALYSAPSIDYVAYPYTPLYFWVSAAVARLTGVGLLAPRLVSFLASLASMVLLYLLVAGTAGKAGRLAEAGRARAAAGRAGGLVAAGLFAAGFRLSGGFYDIARVDSLFIALTLACLLVTSRARRPAGFALAGVVACLAVLTKQSALIALAPVALWLLAGPRGTRRHGLAFLGGLLVPLAAVGMALNAATSGWFGHTVVGVLAGHNIDPTWWAGFWTHDLLPHLLPAALLAGVAIGLRPGADGRRRAGLLLSAGGGLVLAAYVSRLHSASSENVLIPVVVAAALLAGLALSRLPGRMPWLQATVALACLAQFALLAYPPAAQLPPARQTATGLRLLAVLRQTPGEVLVVAHPWETSQAHKGEHAHAGAIFDVVRTRDARPRRALEASITQAVERERFSVIAFDNDQDYAGFPPLERWYRRVAPPPGLEPPAAASLATPLIGHPTQWWVARRLPADPLPR